MRSVSGQHLLELWERAIGLSPVERALACAEAAGGDRAELLDSPLGRTHALLLELRQDVLGTDITATASCPRCGERVEFTLDSSRLRELASSGSLPRAAGGKVAARPPTPADLLAVAGEPHPVPALVERCVGVVPDELLDEVESAMAAADPLAELLVTSTCAECGTDFDADVDLGAFVWAEVDAAARRLLHDVDVLARAYGWSEPEVLALSDARRASYLRLVLEGAP